MYRFTELINYTLFLLIKSLKSGKTLFDDSKEKVVSLTEKYLLKRVNYMIFLSLYNTISANKRIFAYYQTKQMY